MGERMILEKFEFDKTYKFENYSGIKEVCCDGKTFLNKLALALLIFMVTMLIFNVIMRIITPPSEYISTQSHLNNLYEAIFGLILFSIPTILLSLKVFNFRFYINSKDVICKDWMGRKRNYSTSDIKKIYLYTTPVRYRYKYIYRYRIY